MQITAVVTWVSHSASILLAYVSETLTLLGVAYSNENCCKIQMGKLQLSIPLAEVVESQQQTNTIEILPISLSHVLALDRLPLHHKNPFDRLLIAQANIESATLVSQDEMLSRYSVQLIW